ncbi:shTK domain protein [Ancylostoma caninum]|uniref:ShTK domain protein n=1 Tax=Ancylostoma caninum TaxID=29170 RepID=A0A368GVI4_ANCCA|nr:shTK domain protein [Ancylostoma caninum]
MYTRSADIEPCYGTCTSSRCVAPSNPQSDGPSGVGHPQPPLNEVLEDESCVNLHECCGTWAGKGDCDTKPQVMSTICPASCARCKPAYNVVDNESSGRYWMAENCRMQCGFCGKTRKETYAGGLLSPDLIYAITV